jgi:hypothetical protein
MSVIVKDRAEWTSTPALQAAGQAQIDVYNRARAAGRQRRSALKDVVDWAAAETQAF